MSWLQSLLIALSTFSKVPMVQLSWDKDAAKNSVLFLPVVGILVGGLWWLWYQLARYLALDSIFFATLATVLPILITGGIHLDGFLDTIDALSSHQTKERKLEILKDPNIGAFGFIYGSVYLITWFGLSSSVYQMEGSGIIALGFILSRSLGVLTTLLLPKARSSGMLQAMATNKSNNSVRIFYLFLSATVLGLMIAIAWPLGLTVLVLTGLTFFNYLSQAKRQFGGATGDTTGYFISLCELVVVVGVWLGGVW